MRMDAMAHAEYLAHYGILRKSGRYPWGSGRTPLQRSKTFLEVIKQHEKVDGMTESEIAKAYSTKEYPMSVADVRAMKSLAVTEVKQDEIAQAQKLRDKGMGHTEIARRMSTPDKRYSESTIRSLLEPGRQDRLNVLQQTADMLKRQVEEKKFVDVGAFVEKDLPIGPNPASRIGISPDKFKTALSMLREEGYSVHPLTLPQVGTGELTRYKVLVPPGVTKKDVYDNRQNIRLIAEKTDDRGRTWTDLGIKPPLSIHPDRVHVRYKEDGGADADGVIYVRPGVPDVSLGKSTYAQVRIQVGNGHYLKGMAVYKDDLPSGVDLQFNTNKSNTGNKLDAMKELKRDANGNIDKDNPFGAVIKQGGQQIENGKVVSTMNIVNEEGDWHKWSRNISSQVLSKQSPDLAKTQLDMTYERRRREFEEINRLTNPQVKKKLLDSFADDTDSAAVHLKAANMPRQATKVLLPSDKVKPHEIFAPTFKDGERVVLIRYPHAGTFEIPELTVNNRTREARKLLQLGKGGTAPDAVVIHPKVAEHLSGADFDGDAVVAIPNNRQEIRHTPALEKLKNFDPRSEYGPYHGMKTIDGGTYNAKTQKVEYPKDEKGNERPPRATTKHHQMGDVTNLISDMTIRGAPFDEIARAVRHSMVVIDSEKHALDYKRSEVDNGIRELKKRYQGGERRGASTLITRAGSEERINRRKPAETGPEHPDRVRIGKLTVNRNTGKPVWDPTGEHNVKYKTPDGKSVTKSFESKEAAEKFVREKQPHGEISPRKQLSRKLAETDDAYSLVSEGSGTRMEQIYADHSNRLKAMANEARKTYIGVENIPYDPSAAKVYAHEVRSLEAKLAEAERNAPLERQAQVVANRIVAQRKEANPGMESDELRKIKGQALTEARLRTGAKKNRLGSKKSPITDREWEAIQNGAISNHKLERILRNADLEAIKERATPRQPHAMTSTMQSFARQLLDRGYTYDEVADRLGVSPATITSSLAAKGGD
jgi:hypothetical protein